LVEPDRRVVRIARRMGRSGRGEAGRRLRRRLLLLALLTLGVSQVATVGLADEPTVEPAETPSGFAWKPASVTSMPGGSVAFRNPGKVVPHGVHWTGGSEKPSCSGVPVDEFGTSWSGTCSFAQPGTYTFVCTVHPEEMRGTITVSSGESPAPPPPDPGQPPASAEIPLVEALQLARRQHGGTVRGAITVSSAAVGGRLVVELRAPRAALGGPGNGTVRIGVLRRPLAGSGRLPFAVHLQPAADQALARRGRLSLIANATVRSPGGVAETMTRRVKLSE
jgi:plastocyanin